MSESMEKLIQYLNSIHTISNELRSYLECQIKFREVSKKEFLLKVGHVCRNVYFIEKGLLRCFYLKAETEVCSWFVKEGDVFVSVNSFYEQQPSSECIQALEDSEVYYISHSELQFIYRQFPEFNFITRVLTEKHYVRNEQLLAALRMQRSHERYAYLQQQFPELIQRVPSKYLATYLGITDVTLSNIKARF